MARYPVVLEADDNNTILVSFPDFPQAHTFGKNKDEALKHAVDALETVIEAYIKDRRPIPAPSGVTGEAVELPALVAAKIQLYGAMRERHVKKADLARQLKVHLPQVDRLLDIRHGSRVDQLEACAKALGGRLEIAVVMPPPVGRRTVTKRGAGSSGRTMRVPGAIVAGSRAPVVRHFKVAGKKR